MMIMPMSNDHYGFKHKDTDFSNRRHPGYDYNGAGGGNSDLGLPLVAIAPSEISAVLLGHNKGWGNIVVQKINMEQFFIGYGLARPGWSPKTIWVKYAHCSKIFVKEGDKVQAGEKIAELGGTGGWSAHLHWDMKTVSNGVKYYPPGDISEKEFDRIYLDNEKFIAAVNEYIVVSQEQGNAPTSDLIKAKGKPEVYYFNGEKKFHIPDMYTLETLFPEVEIEEIKKSKLKQIKDGDPFPSIKI